MRAILVVCVIALAIAGASAAAAAGLPVESVGAVYVMPTSAEAGFGAGLLTVGLPIPDAWTIGGTAVGDVVKGAVVLHKRGAATEFDDISLYPGLALAVERDIGLRSYVGVCYLPTVKYRTAWFAGIDLLTVEF